MTVTTLAPVYLKVNRRQAVATRCMRFWASVVEGAAEVYLVCDWDQETIARWVPPELRYSEVVPTSESALRALRGMVAPSWVRAGAAQMTATHHAVGHQLGQYWTIDADDTMFVHDPGDVRARMIKVQSLMYEQQLSAASLDFYHTYLDHWSFGLACFRDDVDYFKLLAGIDLRDVARHFPDPHTSWDKSRTRDENGAFIRPHVMADINVDYLFTYLRDIDALRAVTFYFEDVYFFHIGTVPTGPAADRDGYTVHGLYHWKDGALWDDPIRREAIRI